MKLNRILVPLDGSQLAERALPTAEALSRASGAMLVLMRSTEAHTFPTEDVHEAQRRVIREAEEYLEAVAERHTTRGLKIETALPYGDPASWILDEVPLRHIDLVVMATHGRSGPGRWVYGSVAERVIARCKVPVLLVRAGLSDTPQESALQENPRLLVPLDGSPFAEAALPIAHGLAEILGAELVLVSAVQPPYSSLVSETGVTVTYLDQEIANVKAKAHAYLSDLVMSMARDGWTTPTRIEVGVGDPAQAIVDISRELQPVLVVMATHGRTGVLRALVGSVAGQVLQRGTTPLLLVRPAPPPLSRDLLPGEEEAEGSPPITLAVQLTTNEAEVVRVALGVYGQTASRHAHAQNRIRQIQAKLNAAEATANARGQPAPQPQLAR